MREVIPLLIGDQRPIGTYMYKPIQRWPTRGNNLLLRTGQGKVMYAIWIDTVVVKYLLYSFKAASVYAQSIAITPLDLPPCQSTQRKYGGIEGLGPYLVFPIINSRMRDTRFAHKGLRENFAGLDASQNGVFGSNATYPKCNAIILKAGLLQSSGLRRRWQWMRRHYIFVLMHTPYTDILPLNIFLYETGKSQTFIF